MLFANCTCFRSAEIQTEYAVQRKHKNVVSSFGKLDTQTHSHRRAHPLSGAVSESSCGMLSRRRRSKFEGKWGRRKRRVTPTHAHAYITLSYLLHNLPYSRHGTNTSHSHTCVPVNPHLIPCRVGVNLSLHLHSSGDNDIISTH